MSLIYWSLPANHHDRKKLMYHYLDLRATPIVLIISFASQSKNLCQESFSITYIKRGAWWSQTDIGLLQIVLSTIPSQVCVQPLLLTDLNLHLIQKWIFGNVKNTMPSLSLQNPHWAVGPLWWSIILMTDYLVTGGNRIHITGTPTSEVNSSSLPMWSHARKVEQTILGCTRDQLTCSDRMPSFEEHERN